MALTLKTLLAIDPAAAREVSNSGWAFCTFSDEEPFAVVNSGIVTGGFPGFRDDWAVKRLINAANVVVCEKYVPFQRAGDPSPMMIEGMVSFLRPDTVFQPSSGKNTVVPDKLLKALGLWSTAGHHHDEREAVRHALLYLIKQQHPATLELVRKAHGVS